LADLNKAWRVAQQANFEAEQEDLKCSLAVARELAEVDCQKVIWAEFQAIVAQLEKPWQKAKRDYEAALAQRERAQRELTSRLPPPPAPEQVPVASTATANSSTATANSNTANSNTAPTSSRRPRTNAEKAEDAKQRTERRKRRKALKIKQARLQAQQQAAAQGIVGDATEMMDAAEEAIGTSDLTNSELDGDSDVMEDAAKLQEAAEDAAEDEEEAHRARVDAMRAQRAAQ
jgi:hypothetical protein